MQDYLPRDRVKMREHFITLSECAGIFKETQVRVREHFITYSEVAGKLNKTNMHKHIETFGEGV